MVGTDLVDDLVAWLRGRSAIAALVGEGQHSRIYFDAVPQGKATPHLLVQEGQGGDVVEVLVGRADKLTERVVHIYSADQTRSGANRLANTVADELHRFSGDMGGTRIDNVTLNQWARSGIDQQRDGGKELRYWQLQIYFIWSRPLEQ